MAFPFEIIWQEQPCNNAEQAGSGQWAKQTLDTYFEKFLVGLGRLYSATVEVEGGTYTSRCSLCMYVFHMLC